MTTLALIALSGVSFIAGAIFGIGAFVLMVKAERP